MDKLGRLLLAALILAGTWYAPWELTRYIRTFPESPEFTLELGLIWVGYGIAGVALGWLVFKR